MNGGYNIKGNFILLLKGKKTHLHTIYISSSTSYISGTKKTLFISFYYSLGY